MSDINIDATQIGVLVDKSVIVRSAELVNALIQDNEGTVQKLSQLASNITKAQVSVDAYGNVVIVNAQLSEEIATKINSAIGAAGDTNYGICM